jgi:hypothetical protein
MPLGQIGRLRIGSDLDISDGDALDVPAPISATGASYVSSRPSTRASRYDE